MLNENTPRRGDKFRCTQCGFEVVCTADCGSAGTDDYELICCQLDMWLVKDEEGHSLGKPAPSAGVLFTQFIGNQRVEWQLTPDGAWNQLSKTAADPIPPPPTLASDQLRDVWAAQDEMARKSQLPTPLPPSPMDRNTLPTGN